MLYNVNGQKIIVYGCYPALTLYRLRRPSCCFHKNVTDNDNGTVVYASLQSGPGSLTFPRVALRITVASVANLRSPMIDLRRPCAGRHM